MQHEHQLLCASDGEGGHDQTPAASDGSFYDLLQLDQRLARLRMLPAPVRAFHDEVIDRRERLGIADDRQAGASDIARESQAALSRL